jgi:hypothetical protein
MTWTFVSGAIAWQIRTSQQVVRCRNNLASFEISLDSITQWFNNLAPLTHAKLRLTDSVADWGWADYLRISWQYRSAHMTHVDPCIRLSSLVKPTLHCLCLMHVQTDQKVNAIKYALCTCGRCIRTHRMRTGHPSYLYSLTIVGRDDVLIMVLVYHFKWCLHLSQPPPPQ